jgi:hypothetical protein
VGGWPGGGDALSTDPRLTPSGRLVVFIFQAEIKKNNFAINGHTRSHLKACAYKKHCNTITVLVIFNTNTVLEYSPVITSPSANNC